MHYPSGEKSAFVRDDVMKQICRAVYRNQNVINCILKIKCKLDPTSIATVASKLVNRECEGLCKRGTGSILQNTSYKGLFDFTWDQFHKEIQIQAPNTLKICNGLQPYNYTHAKETALHTSYYRVRSTWQIPGNVKSTLPDRTDFGTWRMYSQGTYLIIKLLCNVSSAMIESKQNVILNISRLYA